MKLKKIILVIFLIFANIWVIHAQDLMKWANDLYHDALKSWTPVNPYCQDDECGIDKWIEIAHEWINSIEKEDTSKEYVQKVVSYLLTFVTLIWVSFIIYSWMTVMWAGADEEKVKKSKTTVLYVSLWISLMWAAKAIFLWIINMLNAGPGTPIW